MENHIKHFFKFLEEKDERDFRVVVKYNFKPVVIYTTKYDFVVNRISFVGFLTDKDLEDE